MLTLNSISKTFGKIKVLDNITTDFETGKITSIVGPNGSGKTTIIKTILGLVKPDSGQILINSQPINGSHQYRQKIGYMPQLSNFPENLKVHEVIKMISDLRGLKPQLDDELIESIKFNAELNKAIKTLSGGNKQKLSAYLALVFNPSIIILDEPTAGLDPVVSSSLKKRILEERESGKTIILTSHIMSEIEELSDNIIFLLEGSIVYSGSLESLLESSGKDRLEVAVANMMIRSEK
ncbi:MAG TPA: ABC transporter ATP-binding protein [Ignavibacteriaceae bacterium]|nr:ABC transporter ATP-binding protein [Ignavibacteriaceae bacterium]